MQRPDAESVRHGMRPLVRHSMGSNRVIEAVELNSGPIIVEYKFVNKYKSGSRGYDYARCLAVITAFDRPPMHMTLERGYQDTFPKRRKQQ